MDETTQDTGETDEFSRLLAELEPPTTDPVQPSARSIQPPPPAPLVDFAAMFPPVPPEVAPPLPAAQPLAPRPPELMGADRLAASPTPFPPVPVEATPLTEPPLAQVPMPQAPMPQAPMPQLPTTPRPHPSGLDGLTTSAPPPVDFAAVLAAPVGAEGSAPGFLGLGAGSTTGWSDEPDIGRSTVAEKIVLVVAILLPPIGLIAAIMAAIVSSRRRGWVIGVLRAALVTGVILTVVAGIGGSLGYTQLRQQQQHDQTAAASAAFCATLKANPTMMKLPTFGWPAVAASIPDSLTAMQAFEDRWTKLAKVSPAGINPEVQKIATAAKQIIDGVTVARTVNDASNVAVMSAAASASGVPAWQREYCT